MNKEKQYNVPSMELVSTEIINRWNKLLNLEAKESIRYTTDENLVSSNPKMHHNSLIDSEQKDYTYISEFTNPLFDESDSIVPLTSPVKLFSHKTKTN